MILDTLPSPVRSIKHVVYDRMLLEMKYIYIIININNENIPHEDLFPSIERFQ